MGLIDRVLGLDEPARCRLHPRKYLPCRTCENIVRKDRGFKPESRTSYGPRGGVHTKRTGNKTDGSGNVWCGICDCRVINNKCTNARCGRKT